MKLHVANLSPSVSEHHLQELFSRFGPILDIKIFWSHSLGRACGTGVIEMHTAQALAAAKGLNGRPFRHRRLYVTPLNKEI